MSVSVASVIRVGYEGIGVVSMALGLYTRSFTTQGHLFGCSTGYTLMNWSTDIALLRLVEHAYRSSQKVVTTCGCRSAADGLVVSW